MEPLRRIESAAMALPRANVDTDQIVPARYLKKPRSDNFGDYLFKDLRNDPNFVLNRPEHCSARILVAGANFGCGSSREHAVWALYDWGFRTAIAPSFGDIFASNALKNGFLPVTLAAEEVERLLADLGRAPQASIAVDLEAQTVCAPSGRYSFQIAPFPRRCLLEGIDELGYTLGHMEQVTAFERQYEP